MLFGPWSSAAVVLKAVGCEAACLDMGCPLACTCGAPTVLLHHLLVTVTVTVTGSVAGFVSDEDLCGALRKPHTTSVATLHRTTTTQENLTAIALDGHSADPTDSAESPERSSSYGGAVAESAAVQKPCRCLPKRGRSHGARKPLAKTPVPLARFVGKGFVTVICKDTRKRRLQRRCRTPIVNFV